MGLRIRTNVSSLRAQRNLNNTTNAQMQNMERLSSGYRINKSADDAAGLAISDTLNSKIRSMGQAARNANDGVSMIQVAEGSMNEITTILVRMRELAVQSASDTVGNLERSYTNKEYNELVQEIDRISNSTEYNGTRLLLGTEGNNGLDEVVFHIGAGDNSTPNTDIVSLNIDDIKINTADVLGLERGAAVGPLESDGDFSREAATEKLSIIDTAIKRVAGNRAVLGSKQRRLQSTINNLGTQIENMGTSKSRIKDVDIASEMGSFTQNRILAQAGTSVLAQANATPELALSLLR